MPCRTPSAFAPLYGADSARRFQEHAAANGLESTDAVIPNLCDDVDTIADLERLAYRAAPRTQTAMGAVSRR